MCINANKIDLRYNFKDFTSIDRKCPLVTSEVRLARLMSFLVVISIYMHNIGSECFFTILPPVNSYDTKWTQMSLEVYFTYPMSTMVFIKVYMQNNAFLGFVV